MDVDEDDPVARVERGDLRLRAAERVVTRWHEDAPLQVEDRHRHATHPPCPSPSARDSRRVVGGPQQPRLPDDIVENLFLIEDVVARGHDIDPCGEEILRDPRRDRKPGRGVLDIGHYQVDLPLPAQIPQSLLQHDSTRAPHGVPCQQNSQHP